MTLQHSNFPNVHELLQQAAMESSKTSMALVTQTFKIRQDQKDLVAQICFSNGTTPSEFYRMCTEALIRDYVIKSPEAQTE